MEDDAGVAGGGGGVADVGEEGLDEVELREPIDLEVGVWGES